MPLYYTFTRKDNNTQIDLLTIDNLICEAFNKKPDPDMFSVEYNIITMIGDSLCSRKECKINYTDEIERHCESIKLDAKFKEVALRFLNTEYVYESVFRRSSRS